MSQFKLHLGDCIEVMKTLPDNSVDAVVCDPPYLISFMAKNWDSADGIAGQPDVWRECLRVLKPGGHLLAFSAARTYHRITCAIEDAGFEIRDQIMWVYGSGFPKSMNVSKAIDKAAPRAGMFDGFAKHYAECRREKNLTHNAICAAGGFHGEHNHGGASSNWEKGANVPTVEQWKILAPLLGLSNEWMPLIERVESDREVIGQKRTGDPVAWYAESNRGDGVVDITAPATPAARQWQGWGTALKPAHEPICVARKPLIGTVAANVLAHGTGAINIEACRVGTDDSTIRSECLLTSKGVPGGAYGQSIGRPRTGGVTGSDGGRWPANLIHDGSDEVVALFPQSSVTGARSDRSKSAIVDGTAWLSNNHQSTEYTDTGSAARFFYCPKASRSDRNSGLPDPGSQFTHGSTLRDSENLVERKGNHHPTVKPTDLMAYLVRLVTPPNGTVLDPFMGSGTTGKAAMREGFQFVGIEMDAGYMDIARARIEYEVTAVELERTATAAAISPQLNLFTEDAA